LMGSSLIGVDSTSKICRLLAKDRGRPISLSVAKAFQPETGELFPPLVPLLKRAGLQVEELQKRYFFTKRGRKRNVAPADEGFNPLEDEEDAYNGEEENEEVHGLPCLYLGSVSVGTSGDVDRLGLGIDKVLRNSGELQGQPILLQLRDLHLGLARRDGVVVHRFNYPSIASCGRLQFRHHFFGFISCPNACRQDFMCHVFHSSKEDLVDKVLEHVADGFSRTSFTV